MSEPFSTIGDMIAKGRDNYPHPGEGNGRALLKEVDVLTIRSLFEQGLTQQELAVKYKMSHSAITKIVHRRTWRHI